MFCLGIGISATLLFLVGCGGGSQGDAGQITVTTGSLTKDEFAKQANEICRKARHQYSRAFKGKAELVNQELAQADPAEQAQLARAAQQRLVDNITSPHFEDLIDQISSLGAPSGDEESVTDMLSALQQGIEDLQAHPAKLLELPFERASSLARAYGLDTCANSFT